MSKSRIHVFIVCPQCSGTEMAYPARRERRKKDISSWSMVIPFHSRQFTVGQIYRGEWWCSRCDKSAQQSVQRIGGTCLHKNIDPNACVCLDCGENRPVPANR